MLIDFLLALLVLPVAFVTGVFLLEVVAGLSPLPLLQDRVRAAPAASAVIVIPAHNEAAIIKESLSSLKLAAGDVPILVIADNCTDRTAALARSERIEVIEREDPERRGKGFALAFAAQHLERDPPDVVVILDADCRTDSSSLHALIGEAALLRLPVQSVNLLRPDRDSPPMVQLSTFGFMLKNLVRQRGLQRLSGRVHLTGTGMALPFELFRDPRLATANVVEDLALGIELSERGKPPQLVGEARVWSGVSTQEGTLTQRRRWEGGFLATALRNGPSVLWRNLARGDLRGAFAGLDLLVPPLALLAAVNVLFLLAALLLVLLGGSMWLILVQLSMLLTALAAVFVAWLREGRDFISFRILALLPFYILWKLPLYLRLGRAGAPREWLRTGR